MMLTRIVLTVVAVGLLCYVLYFVGQVIQYAINAIFKKGE